MSSLASDSSYFSKLNPETNSLTCSFLTICRAIMQSAFFENMVRIWAQHVDEFKRMHSHAQVQRFKGQIDKKSHALDQLLCSVCCTAQVTTELWHI